MDNQSYLTASEKTEKKFPEGHVIPAEAYEHLMAVFGQVTLAARHIDSMKKALIYRDPDVQGKPVKILTQSQAEFMHAAMGMVTEVAEIVEALGSDMTIKDAKHFIEELGDVRWYEAIFLRYLGVTADTVQAANINKLATRYPDKFDSHAALNRDLEAERASLEASLEG
jgi:NTP pyrophosphatase (non-canonical NTP hydrolase)